MQDLHKGSFSCRISVSFFPSLCSSLPFLFASFPFSLSSSQVALFFAVLPKSPRFLHFSETCVKQTLPDMEGSETLSRRGTFQVRWLRFIILWVAINNPDSTLPTMPNLVNFYAHSIRSSLMVRFFDTWMLWDKVLVFSLIGSFSKSTILLVMYWKSLKK